MCETCYPDTIADFVEHCADTLLAADLRRELTHGVSMSRLRKEADIDWTWFSRQAAARSVSWSSADALEYLARQERAALREERRVEDESSAVAEFTATQEALGLQILERMNNQMPEGRKQEAA